MFAKVQIIKPVEFRDGDTELQSAYRTIINRVGEDHSREGLLETPKRAAKAMSYLTQGYTQCLDEVVNGALFGTTSEDLVLVRNIEFYSLCEHHMLPFVGRCHIGYLPNGKVLGLSKLARIVDMFARRLQIQENLTRQIAEAIAEVTNAHGVAVHMFATHFCMMMRGVEKQSCDTATTALLGEFRENKEARAELLQQVAATQIGG